jgi:hypothetical protein
MQVHSNLWHVATGLRQATKSRGRKTIGFEYIPEQNILVSKRKTTQLSLSGFTPSNAF